MKCLNCGADAGRKGNKHVRNRRFTCQRTQRELRTKRNWLGRREDYYVDVDVEAMAVPHQLTDWLRSDDDPYSREGNYYTDYSYDSPSPHRSYSDDSYSSRSSDDWGSRSSRSDDYSSGSSYSSWSSLDSGGSGSSYGPSSGSSSSDYGSSSGSSSSSSSSSYDSGSSSSSSFD